MNYVDLPFCGDVIKNVLKKYEAWLKTVEERDKVWLER